ncbi:hypothetical protein VQZ12_000131 [Salmonella enterica]|nr:hypothetical protein [Salmonella enterica]
MKRDALDEFADFITVSAYVIITLALVSLCIYYGWWFFTESDLSVSGGLFLFVVIIGALCIALLLVGEPLAIAILLILIAVYLLYRLLMMLGRLVMRSVRHRRHPEK